MVFFSRSFHCENLKFQSMARAHGPMWSPSLLSSALDRCALVFVYPRHWFSDQFNQFRFNSKPKSSERKKKTSHLRLSAHIFTLIILCIVRWFICYFFSDSLDGRLMMLVFRLSIDQKLSTRAQTHEINANPFARFFYTFSSLFYMFPVCILYRGVFLGARHWIFSANQGCVHLWLPSTLITRTRRMPVTQSFRIR